jgi:Fic family protein
MGREKVHYEAVKPGQVNEEMSKFLNWFNSNDQIDLVLKAAIAHFWFIIIHPFDDGNGRIARAIAEMLLARAENSKERFYSMSGQILSEREKYYQVLKKMQHSSGDITEWLDWFLQCLRNAMLASESTTSRILRKAEFWKVHEHTPVNERQRYIINKLFDGFEGKLQTSKWAKMTKTSADTALRDIKDLVDKGILRRTDEGGRNANYELSDLYSE